MPDQPLNPEKLGEILPMPSGASNAKPSFSKIVGQFVAKSQQ
jgi:hypothetical protein